MDQEQDREDSKALSSARVGWSEAQGGPPADSPARFFWRSPLALAADMYTLAPTNFNSLTFY